MHCFYCVAIGPCGSAAVLDERDHKHLFKTLRATPGERVELSDGRGVFAEAEVVDGRELRVIGREEFPAPPVRVHLFIAPPRRQKMDILLKQCAEVGVWSINPILTARSVSVPEKEAVLDRWQSLLLEGCKQSKNPFLPTVAMPIDFAVALRLAQEQGIKGFFGSPRGELGLTSPLPSGCVDAAWFVGPEGGFTTEEEDRLRDAGFGELRLGPWVLRVETAAVVGAALLLRDLITVQGY